ncbi:probable flavin-containing monooxygenase 1 [Tripterygium wilfordii]|uniref:probable flavin-containing monooxygenase 1 n=1 Tax=Tripterygium wilfordii TaxID=458696 RepID=UPI0018F809E9|nr:probable flavin-containing monooxygenase 1 [Tripterygium wilfordii]
MEKKKEIAIIGAGISGLLACKYTLAKGFNPIVFESTNNVGGVWNKTCETTRLQGPKLGFMFSDFPWPESVTDEFPRHDQVLNYLEAYADHFDLLKHIKFDNKVVGIEYQGPSDGEIQSWSQWSGNGEPFNSKGKWRVEVADTKNNSTQVYQVDFVILCVGRFSELPNIPQFPPGEGPEAFDGKVIHSMDYSAMDDASAAELVKDKRVAVVGFQKSATDIALECSAANGVKHPCTVLYKTEHWNLPDLYPWGVPLFLLYFNRFAELMVHKPGEGFLLSLLATFLAPLRWALSKFVESHIKRKFRLAKFGMVPKHSFLQDINSCLIATLPTNFYDRVEEGSIVLKKSPGFSFCREGIMVDNDNTPLRTDLVILATGYRGEEKLRNIFVNQAFKDSILGSPKEAVPLYRQCIHPRIPQLAVIGFSEAGSNLFTSELRSRWVAELLDGKIKLPRIIEMEKEVSQWTGYWKQYSGPYYRRSCLTALHIWYSDQLCKDMGWNHKRKKGFLANLLIPYGPTDYASP